MDIKTFISSGIIEDYVFGSLPEEDSGILECVMSKNAEVREAVLDAQNTFEQLADAQAVEAPLHLKAEILGRLDFNKTLPKVELEESKDAIIIPITKKSESNNFLKYSLIAASLLLLLSLGFNFFSNKSQEAKISQLAINNAQLSTKITDISAQNSLILNSKNIILNGVEAHPGMLANVYWDNNKKVHLKVNNLPAAPEGKQYQLWAIVDGKPVDAGMFDQNQSDKIQDMKVIENPQAFAITLEKKGGSATPTMEAMYVMGAV